jgi:hypothetical protein
LITAISDKFCKPCDILKIKLASNLGYARNTCYLPDSD